MSPRSGSSLTQTTSLENTVPEEAGAPALEQAPGGFQKIAFLLALVGFFVLHSRVFDVIATGMGFPRLILAGMVLSFLFTGRALFFAKTTGGKIMLGLVVWCCITLPFSIWKGGSVKPMNLLFTALVMFIIMVSLPATVAQVRRMMHGLAFGGLCAALLSIPFGVLIQGRLSLGGGSYLDPNYYALALVGVVPFFWEMASRSNSWVVKIIAWASTAPIFWTIFRTGSRGGMLGLLVALVILFLLSSFSTKILLATVTFVGMLALISITPAYLKTRYLTFFEIDKDTMAQEESGGPNADVNHLMADVASAKGRRQLLITSLVLTAQHPLFGVGPGNFPTAVFNEGEKQGVRREWLLTHNSYTQLSSETGIPGVCLFVALIWTSLSGLRKITKEFGPEGTNPNPDLFSAAKYQFVALAGVAICIFFLAVGFETMIYIWCGLAISLRRVSLQARAAIQPAETADSESTASPVAAIRPRPARVPAGLARNSSNAVTRSFRFNRSR